MNRVPLLESITRLDMLGTIACGHAPPERPYMFSIPGRSLRTCEGLSRREWLRLGGLSSMGLGLDGLLAGRAEADSRAVTGSLSFGRAKSCIVLFMVGAPAHQDSWDMKP
ncbi:MAG: hypothetical protein QF363_12355, partial [Planctomycetaceae bacterium]|nr:hypothetical protein [Planctomycetaceae bacterium]